MNYMLVEKKCDGIVHCVYGEDEFLEECEETYPIEATITCVEDRPSLEYNITIKAIPCNNIKECRSGIDEECEVSENIFMMILLIVFLIICVIWVGLIFVAKNAIPSFELHEAGSEKVRWDNVDCRKFKGKDLVNLKVCLICYQGASS